MISFKQFLQEKAMNRAVFADTLKRLSDQAQMGFEIEVWVNKDSDLFVGEVAGSADYTNLRDVTDIDEFRRLFTVSREVRQDMIDEYQDWKADNRPVPWSEYFKEVFGDGLVGALDFIRTYDIEPKYGWKEENVSVYSDEPAASNDEGNVPWKPIGEEVADALGDTLGRKVNVGYTGKVSDWVVVEDGSIEGPSVGAGIEIVSPPQPIEEAMDDLRECFRFIDQHNMITNQSTGLHINLSIPDLKRLLDPLKLVLFMGEEHVLKQFEREGNTYTKTHADDIIDSITNNGVPPKGSNLVRLANEVLRTEKYRTVNLSKLKAGYLEFRAAGNSGYQSNWNRISDTIGRFLTVLEIACDPTAERKTYLRKVAKIFGKGASQASIQSDSLSQLVRTTAGLMIWQQLEALLKEENISKTMAARYLSNMMVKIGAAVERKNYQPSDKVRAEFRVFLNKFKKRVPGLMDAIEEALHRGEEQDMELFLKAFGLWGK